MEAGPEEFESITGISKTNYERRLLELTRTEMMQTINEAAPARSALRARGSVESVELAGEGLETSIVVMFRLAEVPGVRCGWRGHVWPAPVPDGQFGSSAEDVANLSALGIVEVVESTPVWAILERHLDADGVAWF